MGYSPPALRPLLRKTDWQCGSRIEPGDVLQCYQIQNRYHQGSVRLGPRMPGIIYQNGTGRKGSKPPGCRGAHPLRRLRRASTSQEDLPRPGHPLPPHRHLPRNRPRQADVLRPAMGDRAGRRRKPLKRYFERDYPLYPLEERRGITNGGTARTAP